MSAGHSAAVEALISRDKHPGGRGRGGGHKEHFVGPGPAAPGAAEAGEEEEENAGVEFKAEEMKRLGMSRKWRGWGVEGGGGGGGGGGCWRLASAQD